jgi:hypothetical protein
MERRKTEGEGMLPYRSRVFGEVPVRLKVQQYQDNGCPYVGLDCMEDGCLEPFGNVTVNLWQGAPDYCGYLDVNDLPEVERSITENDLGEFTGLLGGSGYCTYPLYLFHADRLRELCPEGMAAYVAKIGTARKPERKEKSR